MSLLANSNAIETGGYQISRSVRLRSSASANLSRTFGTPTNGIRYTWSGWVKRGALGTEQGVFCQYTSSTDSVELKFISTDELKVYVAIPGAIDYSRQTVMKFRDPSAWYHIVFVYDTAQASDVDRLIFYVNGVRQTSYTDPDGTIVQNCASAINTSGRVHYLGYRGASTNYLDGYLAEINFVDGQALTPSSFGETDAKTGVWVAKKYTGTYGTNGFYLNFSDNSAATSTTIGKDYSGNGNNWTPNNISVTAGVTYDSMTDVPTLTSASAANYAVLNPIATNTIGVATLSNANLNFSIPNTFTAISTMSASSGKYYWEAVATSSPIGIGLKQVNVLDRYSNSIYYMGSSLSASGEKYVNGTGSAYGASWTTNDVIGVAVDMDAGTVTFYKNNVSQGSIALSLATITEFVPSFVSGAGATFVGFVNFGQRPFAYTPPTGFVALNTFNLPTPTIGATASTQANKYFDATTYTGNGSTLAVTNANSFQPDFIWIKQRGGTTSHVLQDSVRGAGKSLFSNATNAESGNSGDLVTSFNSNGFTVNDTYLGGSGGGGTNGSSGSYVGWQWRASNASGVTNTAGSITSTVSANTTAGFSIVTYTGNGGSSATVGHGLGVAPRMLIVKRRDAAFGWNVYHASIGAGNVLFMQTTDAQASSTVWNSTTPTSSVFSLGTSSGANANLGTYVAYCFAEVAGYSKFGSYTGNGSSDGPFVYCGFRPKYVLIKQSSTSGTDWIVYDSTRNPYNLTNLLLSPNSSAAETTSAGSNTLDLLSNGFKLRSASTGSNGGTMIYAAFAENPFKYSNAR